MASFKAKFPVLQELFAKNHRRALWPPPPPPSGARVMCITYISRDSCRNLICKNLGKSDLGHVGRRFVGGWVSGYVCYLELSREPKHVAQQMKYQNVDLSNGHCLGTTIIF